uniref:Uncharacterized protein n=1 Tax=Anopheles dirus TaxID=7168 RepID=A0A182N9F1_9DIPT
MERRQFFLVSVGITLLLVLLVAVNVDVVQSASIYAPDFNDSSAHFLDQQRSCRDLCSFCPTCNGFYCGEECICECSQDPTEHAKCIDLIKANSEKLGLVYDLFIQPPQKQSSRTRFGRRAATPEEKDSATVGRIGFHKILFSNFATKQGASEGQPDGSTVETIDQKGDDHVPVEIAVNRATGRPDPMEKLDVWHVIRFFLSHEYSFSAGDDAKESQATRAKREETAAVEKVEEPDEIVAQPGYVVPARRRWPCLGRRKNFTAGCGPPQRAYRVKNFVMAKNPDYKPPGRMQRKLRVKPKVNR